MCYTLNMNDELINLFENLKFHIEEADFVRVWPFWEDIVAFYPYNRLYLITDGVAHLWLKDKEILLEPGKLYFIPQHSVVKGKCNIFGHYFCHFEIDQPFSNITDFVEFPHSVSCDGYDEQLFKELIANYPCDTPQKLLKVQGTFKLLFSKFLTDTKLVDYTKMRFLSTMEYINNNLSSPMTLDDIAKQADINTRYFCSSFKKVFGVSPWQYVITMRLNKASILLINSEKTIREIAYETGFQDEFYFSRCFKKNLGLSPQAYKSKVKKLQQSRNFDKS